MQERAKQNNPWKLRASEFVFLISRIKTFAHEWIWRNIKKVTLNLASSPSCLAKLCPAFAWHCNLEKLSSAAAKVGSAAQKLCFWPRRRIWLKGRRGWRFHFPKPSDSSRIRCKRMKKKNSAKLEQWGCLEDKFVHGNQKKRWWKYLSWGSILIELCGKADYTCTAPSSIMYLPLTDKGYLVSKLRRDSLI